MKTSTKVLIGGGVLTAIGVTAYVLLKKKPSPAHIRGQFLYNGQPMAVNWFAFKDGQLVTGGAGSSYSFYPSETGTYSIVVQPQEHPVEGVMVQGSTDVQVTVLEGLIERDVILTVRARY